MDYHELIELNGYLPKFVELFELTSNFEGLKKGTLLVMNQNNPWSYYTINGWYADKNSKLSKSYNFVENELQYLKFINFYQYVGKRIVKEYLYDFKVDKIKTKKQLDKYMKERCNESTN